MNEAYLTRWSKNIDPEHILEDYPRPGLRRNSWFNLNGFWKYAVTETTYRVPFETTYRVPLRRDKKKENPELTYHEDNEAYLENIKKELILLTGKS